MDKYNLISKLNNNKNNINIIKSYSTSRIIITEETALNLIEHKNEVLNTIGRIELSFLALDLFINTFINSPHIDQYSFEDTVSQITEIFCSLKNDTYDLIGDKQLIKNCTNCLKAVMCVDEEKYIGLLICFENYESMFTDALYLILEEMNETKRNKIMKMLDNIRDGQDY